MRTLTSLLGLLFLATTTFVFSPSDPVPHSPSDRGNVKGAIYAQV